MHVAAASTTDIAAQKAAMRRQVRAARREMGAAARQAASEHICAQIAALPQFQQAQCVGGFAPMAEEVDIWQLLEDCLRRNVQVALPRIEDFAARKLTFHTFRGRAHLQQGAMGIEEPAATETEIPPSKLDFIFIPAVAVDAKKLRLGYGGGFYDKVLLNCSAVCTCAPVFRCQIAEVLPCENHDQSVHLIVSA